MTATLIEMSSENTKQIAFMQPLWIEDTVLLQPFPKEESRLSTPIRPFSQTVYKLF